MTDRKTDPSTTAPVRSSANRLTFAALHGLATSAAAMGTVAAILTWRRTAEWQPLVWAFCAICFVFYSHGLLRNPKARRPGFLGFLGPIVVLLMVMNVGIYWYAAMHPTIGVRNAGKRPVLLRWDRESEVVQPGWVVAVTHSLGATLEVVQAEADGGNPLRVSLDREGKMLSAMVNADDPTRIRFEYE